MIFALKLSQSVNVLQEVKYQMLCSIDNQSSGRVMNEEVIELSESEDNDWDNNEPKRKVARIGSITSLTDTLNHNNTIPESTHVTPIDIPLDSHKVIESLTTDGQPDRQMIITSNIISKPLNVTSGDSHVVTETVIASNTALSATFNDTNHSNDNKQELVKQLIAYYVSKFVTNELTTDDTDNKIISKLKTLSNQSTERVKKLSEMKTIRPKVETKETQMNYHRNSSDSCDDFSIKVKNRNDRNQDMDSVLKKHLTFNISTVKSENNTSNGSDVSSVSNSSNTTINKCINGLPKCPTNASNILKSLTQNTVNAINGHKCDINVKHNEPEVVTIDSDDD